MTENNNNYYNRLLVLGLFAALSFLSFQHHVIELWQSSTSIRETTVQTNAKKASNTTTTGSTLETLPPLSSLIGDKRRKITGNVDFLLHHAIIGHAKTGTSFLLRYLRTHKEIQMPKLEVAALYNGRPATLVEKLYRLPAGKRGYKFPEDIHSPLSLYFLYKFWPSAKLIVGLRHPIRWFESFYNFRLRGNVTLPNASTLIHCVPESLGVCADGGNFHVHLSLLGKTNHSEPAQAQLLQYPDGDRPQLPPLPHKVFVYDMLQIQDTNVSRLHQFRTDLSTFLDLSHPLAMEPLQRNFTSFNDKNALDICQPQYQELRNILLRIAQNASIWIRTYFLKSPDVVVSSPTYLNELLDGWMVDPCQKQATKYE